MKKLGLVILLELFWAGALSAQNLQQLLAKRDFRTAVELIDGMLVKAKSNERTSLVIQKARCLRNMRDLEGAISVLDNESLNNQSVELLSELADYHAAAGNHTQALELYEILCKKSFENEYFLIQKALLENATKDYVGSLETCHRIFEKERPRGSRRTEIYGDKLQRHLRESSLRCAAGGGQAFQGRRDGCSRGD